jgi:hypothetical protein
MRGLSFIVMALGLGAGAVAEAQEAYRLYRSAGYLGRGDTGIAIADDEEAIFYNPAGVALGKGIYKKTVLVSPQIEMSSATRDTARRLSAEDGDTVETIKDQIGKNNHLGVTNFTGLILRRAALGAFMKTDVDIMSYKDPEQGGLESVEARAGQAVGATFTLADSFFSKNLYLGVTGKYIARGRGEVKASTADADAVKEQVKDQSNFLGMGEGGGGDFGLMYRGGGRVDPSFGITIADIGDTKITPTEPTELDLDVKQTVNLGVAISPGTKFSKFRLLADYRDAAGRVITNPRRRVHLGGEINVLEMVGATAGFNQGGVTAGLYLDIYFFRFDVGMYTEEIDDRVGVRSDTRYFFRLKAGF